MKKIMHLIMLSCKKATELIEKKGVVGLSLRERFQLHIHKSMCDACTAYEKQSLKIDELLSKGNHLHNTEKKEPNQPLKDKIISKLP